MTNEAGDNSGNLVQAGTIYGGVHFHTKRMPPPDQVPRATPHFTNQHDVLSKADRAFAEVVADAAPGYVVLTGPPGSGKREAARTWVRRHRDDFPDGVFHANLTDAAAGAEAECLGDFLVSVGFAAEQIPDSLQRRADLFRSWSATRRVAIVVERALTPAQVRPLAPSGHGSVVLVTAAGPLDGLSANAFAKFVEVAPLEESAARKLFERIAGPERALAEPDAVTEVLRIADGLPIAVCVVASMVAAHPRRTMTRLVGQLRDERQRLRALSRSDAELSVTTVFNTAYGRLSEPVRALYRAAGLHPGIDAFGAEVLAAALGWDEHAVFDALDALVDARLLTELPGERYAMHSLVRAHARQVDAADDDADERDAVLRGVLAYYRDRAVAAGHRVSAARGWWELFYPGDPVPDVPGLSTEAEAWTWLRTERENLRAVVDVAFELGEHRLVGQLCVMLWPLHERDKALDDLRHCDELGVESAARTGDVSVEALLIVQLGIRQVHLGRFDDARTLFERAKPLAERSPHLELLATTVESHGLAEIRAGERERAGELLSENLRLAERLTAPAGDARLRRLALARFHLAKVHPLESALTLLAEAEQALSDLGDTYNVGKVAQWRGRRLTEDRSRAAQAHAELTRAAAVLDRPFDRMATVEALGDLAASGSDVATAAERYREALAIAENDDYPHDVVRLKDKLAAQGVTGPQV